MDLPPQCGLGPVLRWWLNQRTAHDIMSSFTYLDYLKAFKKAIDSCGVSCLSPSPYTLRHTGASVDRALRCRTLLEVQQRGGWKSFSSVRRYDKHGRLGRETHKLPATVLLRLQGSRERVLQHFARCCNRPSITPA